MASRISELVEDASSHICVSGSITHFYSTCDRTGWVNAKERDGDPPCTACEINEVAEEIRASRRVSG